MISVKSLPPHNFGGSRAADSLGSNSECAKVAVSSKWEPSSAILETEKRTLMKLSSSQLELGCFIIIFCGALNDWIIPRQPNRHWTDAPSSRRESRLVTSYFVASLKNTSLCRTLFRLSEISSESLPILKLPSPLREEVDLTRLLPVKINKKLFYC